MQDVFKALKSVYENPRFIFLNLALFFLFLLFIIWLPNLGFILHRLFLSELSFFDRIDFFISTLGALKTNFTFASRIVSLLVIFFFSVNLTMFVFYLKEAWSFQRETSSSLLGAILGLVGVGCASCGSVILSSVFGFTVAAGILTFLPFKGLEFSFVSLIFLGMSIVWLGRKISRGIACNWQPTRLPRS